MALSKTAKKCARKAQQAARKFGPAVAAQVMGKCLRKAGLSLDGVRRRKHRRKGRR